MVAAAAAAAVVAAQVSAGPPTLADIERTIKRSEIASGVSWSGSGWAAPAAPDALLAARQERSDHPTSSLQAQSGATVQDWMETGDGLGRQHLRT